MYFKGLNPTSSLNPNIQRDMTYELLEVVLNKLKEEHRLQKDRLYAKAVDGALSIIITREGSETFVSIDGADKLSMGDTSMLVLLYDLPAVNHNLLHYAYRYGIDEFKLLVKRDSMSFRVASGRAPIINDSGDRQVSRVFFSLKPEVLANMVKAPKSEKRAKVKEYKAPVPA